MGNTRKKRNRFTNPKVEILEQENPKISDFGAKIGRNYAQKTIFTTGIQPKSGNFDLITDLTQKDRIFFNHTLISTKLTQN